MVGAGPTGVEFIGELRDWLECEGKKYFGYLLKYVSIILIEAGQVILPVFDASLQQTAFNKITSMYIL